MSLTRVSVRASDGSDPDDPEESRGNLFLLLGTQVGGVTTHGVPRAFQHDGCTFHRILWLMFSMGGLIGLGIVLKPLLEDYISNPKTVLLTTEVSDSLPFPAVTICNANGMRASYYLDNYNNSSPFSNEYRNYQDALGKNTPYTFVDWPSTDFKARKIGSLWNVTAMQAGVTPLDYMVPKCTKAGQDCTAASEWSIQPHIKYGACRTFNFNGNFNQSVPGQPGGFSALLQADKYDSASSGGYNSQRAWLHNTTSTQTPNPNFNGRPDAATLKTESKLPLSQINAFAFSTTEKYDAGIFVTFHEPGYSITPETLGYFMTPYEQFDFVLTKKVSREIPPPHGKCNKTEPRVAYTGKYTLINCVEACKQQFIYAYAGCPYYSLIAEEIVQAVKPGDAVAIKSTEFCTSGASNSQKVEEALKFFATGQTSKVPGFKCTCPSRCENVEYSYLVAKSSIETRLNLIDFLLLRTTANKFLPRYDQIVINAYFETLSYTQVVESAKWDFSSLTGAIGGNLGVFLGMSVMSLLEWGEILVDAIIMSICGCPHKRRGCQWCCCNKFDRGNPEEEGDVEKNGATKVPDDAKYLDLYFDGEARSRLISGGGGAGGGYESSVTRGGASTDGFTAPVKARRPSLGAQQPGAQYEQLSTSSSPPASPANRGPPEGLARRPSVAAGPIVEMTAGPGAAASSSPPARKGPPGPAAGRPSTAPGGAAAPGGARSGPPGSAKPISVGGGGSGAAPPARRGPPTPRTKAPM